MFRITLCSASLLFAGGVAFAQTDSDSIAAAAQAGEPGAAFDYGYDLIFPESGEPDFAAGRDWLNRAAEAGDPAANYVLGMIYRDGIGTDADVDRARTFFQRGWEQGDPASGFSLAELLIFEYQDEIDTATGILEQVLDDEAVGALAHLTLADTLFFFADAEAQAPRAMQLAATALQRDPQLVEAHYLLGIGAMEGIGRDSDPVAAMTHWRQGAEGGDTYSMMALADAHRDGVNGRIDLTEAQALYAAAAALDHPDAGEAAEELAADLTVQQRQAAEARMQQWLATGQ